MDDDNDGNGATGNEVDDDGDGAMGNEDDNDNGGNNDNDNDDDDNNDVDDDDVIVDDDDRSTKLDGAHSPPKPFDPNGRSVNANKSVHFHHCR